MAWEMQTKTFAQPLECLLQEAQENKRAAACEERVEQGVSVAIMGRGMKVPQKNGPRGYPETPLDLCVCGQVSQRRVWKRHLLSCVPATLLKIPKTINN